MVELSNLLENIILAWFGKSALDWQSNQFLILGLIV